MAYTYIYLAFLLFISVSAWRATAKREILNFVALLGFLGFLLVVGVQQ